MIPPPGRIHGSPACEFCGAALDAHQVVGGGVCADDACRRRLAVRHGIEREAARKQKRHERLAALREELLREEPPERRDGLPLVALPAFTRRVGPLPAERREEFVEHLRGVIERAFGALERGETEEDPLRSAIRPVDPPDRAALGAACGLCRGHCCRLGARSHAFLEVPTIVRYLGLHPDATPDEVLEAYLSRLPGQSYEESCVYHGERGCTLDDDRRAAVCGWYLCDGLKEWLAVPRAGGHRRALLIADGEETRAAVLDEDGRHPRPVPPQVRAVDELPA